MVLTLFKGELFAILVKTKLKVCNPLDKIVNKIESSNGIDLLQGQVVPIDTKNILPSLADVLIIIRGQSDLQYLCNSASKWMGLCHYTFLSNRVRL